MRHKIPILHFDIGLLTKPKIAKKKELHRNRTTWQSILGTAIHCFFCCRVRGAKADCSIHGSPADRQNSRLPADFHGLSRGFYPPAGPIAKAQFVPVFSLEHQPEIVCVGPLPGVGLIAGGIASAVAHFAPGVVAQFGNLCAVGIHRHAGGTQMIRE